MSTLPSELEPEILAQCLNKIISGIPIPKELKDLLQSLSKKEENISKEMLSLRSEYQKKSADFEKDLSTTKQQVKNSKTNADEILNLFQRNATPEIMHHHLPTATAP